MLPIEKFKQALGDQAHNMDELEIERLRTQQDKLADVLFDFWLEQKNTSDIF